MTSVYDSLNAHRRFACRVIADHARATAFAIADGILPGNEGRNYVLHKIMRRAIYHGREHLGLTEPFFYKVCDIVVENMHEAYPELAAQRDFIIKMVRVEEERFGSTVTTGLKKLDELIDSSKSRVVEGSTIQMSPDELASLYDTYGLPIDLMFFVLGQKQMQLCVHNEPIDISSMTEEKFREIIEIEIGILQDKGDGLKQIGKTSRKSEISPIYADIKEKIAENVFLGYETTQVEDATVIALLQGNKEIKELRIGEQGCVILDKTPFYAESGGQVGDIGKLHLDEGSATVNDTFSPIPSLIVHKVTVEHGKINPGDKVIATVDVQERDATRRNHTATHLMHAALREVLGTHVKQSGSVVAPSYLRFDFTHYQPLTLPEVTEIEDLVNRYILENHPVNTALMTIEEAMQGGATALFGEKYGSDVRVLSVGDGRFSKELCGGTHVRATGDIGSFKITSDEAVASGVRRIRAITGFEAFERLREDEKLIDRSLGALKTQRDNLPAAIEKLQEELKRVLNENEELRLKIATLSIGEASEKGDEAREIAGVKVLGKIVEGLDGNGIRQLSDTLLARLKSGIVVLGRAREGKVGIIVRVSDDLTASVKAGNVIKEIVPIVGGRGGGRPDMAEGGGTEPEKLAAAIDASYGVIEKMLG